jgi:hypothetical protein
MNRISSPLARRLRRPVVAVLSGARLGQDDIVFKRAAARDSPDGGCNTIRLRQIVLRIKYHPEYDIGKIDH